MITVISIIMDISIAHNLQLKARVQCAYRKMQYIYTYIYTTGEEKKKQSTPGYLNNHTIYNHTIQKKKKHKTTTKTVFMNLM